MDLRDRALELHRAHRGKISVQSKVPLRNKDDLSLAYTPGVAEPCREIQRKQDLAYEYTSKGNLVAIVTDGSAVLGLGNIGPVAALPVMEGKALLFKRFAGVDAFPLCVASTDIEDVVRTVKLVEPTFGGVNLEDISAPRCFEIERRLKEELDIPVFHDDQHGTAIVVLAALLNALKIVEKNLDGISIIINGAGAAGIATCRLLLEVGAGDVVLCDTNGVLHRDRVDGMNDVKRELALVTNRRGRRGSLADAMEGADVFIGVSTASVVTPEMVKLMRPGALVFAMANPVPEIMPERALEAGAAVVGTGRSDFPNQINNVLAFPGVLRGALDVRARDINDQMKISAAHAIASLILPDELRHDYVIPKPFDPRVAPAVARAVAEAAIETGVARVKVDPADVERNTWAMVMGGQE